MLIQAFVPTKGAQMYCLLLKYYISKSGEGAACADTRGGGFPKFVKTYWRNTWTLPNHEILSPDAGFFDKGRCQRHHEQGYLQIGNDHKAFVPLEFWEKLFVPLPLKKKNVKRVMMP